MKESGMDKLIELRCLIKPLEEYLLELAKRNPLYTNFNINLPGVSVLGVHETILISKKFGFIKWLVDNDKIDFDRCECRHLYNALKRSENNHGDKNFTKYERILMLLSIQDNPIEFLCEILK